MYADDDFFSVFSGADDYSLGLFSEDPKSAAAPAAPGVSPDPLNLLSGLFGGSPPLWDGAHDGADKECSVCYTEFDDSTRHSLFTRCGHGNLLCFGCANRVHRCPMCRDIKEGYEAFVLATEALSGRPCDEGINDPETSYYLPHDESPSCSASAPAPPSAVSDDIDADLEAFLAGVGTDEPASMPEDANHSLHGASLPSLPSLVQSTLDHGEADDVGDTVVGMDEDEAPAVTAVNNPTSPSLAHRGNRDVLSRRRGETSIGARQTTARRKMAIKSTSPSTSSSTSSPSLSRKSNAITQDKENPFAYLAVPDQEVEELSYKDFQDLMSRHNFSTQQMSAAKKFRKRLKNRKQVMQYADKKRFGTSVLQVQNQQLTDQVNRLTQENTDLRERNQFLEQTLEILEQERADAVDECSFLQQQVQSLTSQMGDMGFFDTSVLRQH